VVVIVYSLLKVELFLVKKKKAFKEVIFFKGLQDYIDWNCYKVA